VALETKRSSFLLLVQARLGFGKESCSDMRFLERVLWARCMPFLLSNRQLLSTIRNSFSSVLAKTVDGLQEHSRKCYVMLN